MFGTAHVLRQSPALHFTSASVRCGDAYANVAKTLGLCLYFNKLFAFAFY